MKPKRIQFSAGAGKAVSYTYHPSGRIATRLSARGFTTTYDYTPAGELQSVSYQGGTVYTPNVTYSDFDRLGRPGKISQAYAGDEILTYRPGTGALVSRRYAANHSYLPGKGVSYPEPDAAGRPAGFDETAGSSVVRSVSYAYDSAGRLEAVAVGGESHHYTYPPGFQLPATVEARDGATPWFRETRHRDNRGRLLGIRSQALSGGSVAADLTNHAYTYDGLGRRQRATFQDGSSWQYGYNARSEVVSATRRAPGSAATPGAEIPQLASSYTYDAIGNRLTSASPVLGNHTYTPNTRNQYQAVTTSAERTVVGRAPLDWTVLVNGMAAGRSGELFHRTLGAANAAAPVWQTVVTQRDNGTHTVTGHLCYAAATASPVYDEDGNLANDGRWVYTWDAENRLVKMEARILSWNLQNLTPVTVSGEPYARIEFAYDPLGRRMSRTVFQGSPVNTPAIRRWLYDGWNPVVEFSGGSLVRELAFTWGLDLSGTFQGAGGVGGLLAQTKVNGTPATHRPSYDGNGNITAWTARGATAPAHRREYDPFGNVVVSEGTTPSGFGFSTKMEDPVTGLYYYGYRYYDPIHGRWPSRDPLGERGGVNLYGFIGNNGVNLWDVLGLELPDYLKCCKIKKIIVNFNQIKEAPNHKVSEDGMYNNKTGRLFLVFCRRNVYTFTPPFAFCGWCIPD